MSEISPSSPLDKQHKSGATSRECSEFPNSYIPKDQKIGSSIECCVMELQKMSSVSTASKVSESRSQSGLLALPPLFGEGNQMNPSGSHYENGLFSSSLSEIFNQKLKFPSSIPPIGQSVDSVNSNSGEDEPFESMEEIEAQTIGNLLPDDDDLLSGIMDDIGYIGRSNNGNDIDDDIFYSGGGMELESEDNINGNRTSEFVGVACTGQQGEPNGSFAGEHPYGEHPSRTLFVRNINSNVEDGELRAMFEQYGDIRTLYTACKHRGFVMISYYDIRAARGAMRALQNKPLRRRKIDIHFSIPKYMFNVTHECSYCSICELNIFFLGQEDNPTDKDINQGTLVIFNLDSSVTNDDLQLIFGIYGEIKEIRETPHKNHQKFIEFYDVRSAEAALHALNRSDIAGKKIMLEPSHPGGARRSLMQHLSSELEQEELNGSWQGSPNNSLPGCFGSSSLGAITTSNLENGVFQGLHSAIKVPVTPLREATLHGISSSIPQHISSPIRVASVGSHTNQADISHSLGQMNFGFQGMHGLHPHSLPNYQNGSTNCIPYKTSTGSAVGIGVISRPSEGNDNRHLQKVRSGTFSGHSFDPNKAFGVSTNGSCPPHGRQHVWNNTNAFHHKATSTMSWSNSPSFVGNIPAHQPSQIQGIPVAQPHILNAVVPLQHHLPLQHHHVGSAPTVNPSLWERRHTYAGDAMEPPGFHPGSRGSMGLSSISQLESLASRNFFSHNGGNCLDPGISSPHTGIPSPQQRCQMFHGRNQMIPMPGSFDGPTDRMRGRRNDTNANQGDNKKQYELDIEHIIHGEDSRTTLMIKNIPNKYTSKMLLAAIDENHRGTYDFIYLPIDFKNKCNVGYAFINMINPQHIIPFYQSFNGKKWEKFNSEKVASLAYARIQGKAALIAHFQNSSLMNEDKRCRPILFHTDGPNAGDQEPFPVGTNIRSRSGRSRTMNGNEENNQGGTTTSANGEASSDAVGSSPGSSTKDLE